MQNECFLVWIDGQSKKPSKIPNDIISRFKSLERSINILWTKLLIKK